MFRIGVFYFKESIVLIWMDISMKKLNLAALEVFVAAVEEKSLSKAADRENLVISAVSKRISELEGNLNRALLVRHGRGVDPTPAGMLLYQHAKLILRNVVFTQKMLKNFSEDGIAKLRVAANPSAMLQFLPKEFSNFFQYKKNLSVELIEGHSHEIPRMVAEASVDLGIYHAQYPAVGVHSFPFATDRVGLVVPLTHPLAKKDILYLEEALEYDFLGYFPRHSLDHFLEYVGNSISRPPKVKLQVSNFETRCSMIREGLGIGIVPENIAENYLTGMGLKLLGLKDEWAKRDFFVCIANSDECSEVTLELFEHLVEVSPFKY